MGYIDEKGYQYVFENGKLAEKQIGGTTEMIRKWEKTHPYLLSEVRAEKAKFDNKKAQQIAEQLIGKEREDAQDLKKNMKLTDLGLKVIFNYTPNSKDQSVLVVIDKVSGEIISYNNYSFEPPVLREGSE